MTILCVTPNPALDRHLHVPMLTAGDVLRARRVRCTAGGKGINVARALSALGCPAVCAGPLGGHTGRTIAEATRQEGLDAVWTWHGRETRTTTIVVDDSGKTTVINDPGPALGSAGWETFVADVAAASVADAVCISGSLPPDVPPGGTARLIDAAREGGAPVWVDTAGDALGQALAAKPFGIKINAEEAGACLGQVIADAEGAVTALRAMRGNGMAAACITLGSAGAVLAAEGGVWYAAPPAVTLRNGVGAGDSFLAGLMAGFDEGLDAGEALRLAVAVATASVTSDTPGGIDRALAARMRSAVMVTRLQ